MKNQKWIYWAIAGVVVLALVIWYWMKKKAELADTEPAETTETKPTATTYAKPGEANKVSELSPACQKVYNNWLAWMKKEKGQWYLDIETAAKKSNTPIDKALENNWLWTYNQGSVSC